MDETCTGEAQPSDSVAFAAVGNSKRPRREIRTLRTVLSTSNLQTAMQHEVQHASGGNEVDLGKALGQEIDTAHPGHQLADAASASN